MTQYKPIFKEKKGGSKTGHSSLFKLIESFDVFYIPDFQRFYRWDNKNLSQLINDVENSMKNKTDKEEG